MIGLYIGSNNTNIQISNHTFYNNGYDFYTASGSSTTTFNMTTSYFLNPQGSRVSNYTVLSINDSVAPSTSYFINWTTNSSTLPNNRFSFAQKYVNITNISGVVSIDAITWHWLESELGATYNESGFELWKYNTAWTLLNNTPNTTTNTLSLTDMNPASIYGILQNNLSNCPIISSPGTYNMTNNYVGAPNDVSEVAFNDSACVKIAASNVTFDCNGYDITGDGTDAAYEVWMGIVLNGSLTNVTVRNCPAISNYTYGIYVSQSDNSVFTNNTAFNNSYYGLYFAASSNNNLTNNRAYNNLQGGFYFTTGSNNNLTNNSAYNNTGNGFWLDSSLTYNILTNNSAYKNAQNGFYINSFSTNNNLTNNSAYNNSQNGFYINSFSTNNNLTNNRAYNNTQNGFFVVSSTGCVFTGNNASFNNAGFFASVASNTVFTANLAFWNPTEGFVLDTCSGAIISGNTIVSDGLERGYGIYLVSTSSSNITNNTVNAYDDAIHLDFGSTGNVIWNNTANGNVGTGLTLVAGSDGNTLENNTANNNQNGFAVTTNGNTITNNTASSNRLVGFYLYSGSTGNNISGNTAYNNTQYGVELSDSSDNAIINDHYYGNGRDLMAQGASTINLSRVIFDRPAGDFISYTNLSANDSLAGDSYSITWANISASLPLPAHRISFALKCINITAISGTVSIDSMVWNWIDSETTSYNDSRFGLWEFNGTWVFASDTLNATTNTLSISNLGGFSDFAILQENPQPPPPPPSDVVTPPTPSLSITSSSSCTGNTIIVRSGSSEIAGASVVIEDPTTLMTYASGTTNDAGQMRFDGCGRTLRVSADKGGYGKADATVTLVSCEQCAGCLSDDNCTANERCTDRQCVPVECSCGEIKNHACLQYSCCSDSGCKQGEVCKNHACTRPQYECTSDADCAANKRCVIKPGEAGGVCEEITGCGTAENHTLVPYQCGPESGCPSCPKGRSCVQHRCVLSDLKGPASAFIGTNALLQATEDGKACVACELQITDPTGKVMTGRTGSDGIFRLPLLTRGIYKIALLSNGSVVKAIEVNALPKSPPSEENPPTLFGTDVFGAFSIAILLLLALILAIIYYMRRKKKA